MTESATSCPLTYPDAVDAYYLEHRAKLIDLAAFLDRLERAEREGDEDFRVVAFRRALALLTDGQPERARRVLEILSDHTTDPIDQAPMKGALGAVPLEGE